MTSFIKNLIKSCAYDKMTILEGKHIIEYITRRDGER